MTGLETLLADSPLLVGVLGGLLLGSVVTGVVAYVISLRRAAFYERQFGALEAELAGERRIAEERERAFAEARERLEESFSLLSDRVLDRSSKAFLQLAEDRFKLHRSEAASDLKARQQAIQNLVQPIAQALEKTERQVQSMEKERKEAFGALEQHLKLMAEDHRELRRETGNLVQALRRPEVRGQWGELSLRRLVEMVGMIEHCDFSEQVHVAGSDGALRPDMVIHLPDERDIVVDVKTPLDAYLTAHEASDEQGRERALAAHARNVRARVKQLADKAYWEQFKSSPDFVVLFVPGEQFLAAALDQDARLLEDALRQKVILASPTSLVALLRAVAFSWRQVDLIRNAEEIRSLAEDFYRRVGTFSEHYGRLGRSLAATVDHFNKTVGSLQRQVLPSALKLSEMGVAASKEIETPGEIERKVRDV
ncbi:MAG: DNA recombination protein RmuC [Xanthomonadales bacterium]|nr:DNA recombination protein RmuC [Xanthomonadales bacterium]